MSAHKDPHSHISIVENGDGVNIEWTTHGTQHVSASIECTEPPIYKRRVALVQPITSTRTVSSPMRHRRHAR